MDVRRFSTRAGCPLEKSLNQQIAGCALGTKRFLWFRFFDAHQRNELGRAAGETLLIFALSMAVSKQEQDQTLSPSATSFLLIGVKRNEAKKNALCPRQIREVVFAGIFREGILPSSKNAAHPCAAPSGSANDFGASLSSEAGQKQGSKHPAVASGRQVEQQYVGDGLARGTLDVQLARLVHVAERIARRQRAAVDAGVALGKVQPVAAVGLERERSRFALAQAHAVQPGLLADGQAAVFAAGRGEHGPAAAPGLRIEGLLRVRRRGVDAAGLVPDLQEMRRDALRPVELAVLDAVAGAHPLQLARPKRAFAAVVVAVRGLTSD